MTWWNASWGYRKKVTLKCATYVVHRTDTDHVILVQQVAADSDFWGHVAATGADVRFVAADDTTELKFYFQRFDNTNDLMDAQVLVTDRFEPAVDIDLYMYYGNAGASDAQDAANTLTNYLAVYHCDEGTGTAVSDKKGAYNATASNSAIWDTSTQKLGIAGLNPATAYYAYQDTLLDTPPANLSIGFWFNPTGATNKYILDKWNTSGETDYLQITTAASNTTIHVDAKGGGITSSITTTTTMSSGTWYHGILAWSTSLGLNLYLNGVWEAGNAAATSLMGPVSYYDFTIGAYHGGGYICNGKIDEFKVMSIGLTEDDAQVLYRSENGDLQTYAAEESAPAAGQFMTGKKYW